MIEELLVRWIEYIAVASGWVIVLVLGVGLVIDGYDRHAIAKQLRTTPTTATNAISPADDVVECHGTARPHPDHGTLDAPFSNAESLYTDWELEKLQGRHVRSVGDGTVHVPFLLDDGAGRIEVDPDGFDVVRLSPDMDPGYLSFFAGTPETATEFITSHVDADPSFLQRCSQSLLEPGDEVYVYGHPEHAADSPAHTAVRSFPEDSSSIAVLSNFSRRRLHLEAIAGWIRICYGAILSILTLLIGLAVFDLVSYSWVTLVLLIISMLAAGWVYDVLSSFCRKLLT